jgi:large subunit ribosomal protein L15
LEKVTKGEIKPKDLVKAGIIKKEAERIKILGQGDISSPKTIHAHKFSAAALKKIEDAGGKAVLIGS